MQSIVITADDRLPRAQWFILTPQQFKALQENLAAEDRWREAMERFEKLGKIDHERR